jgi:sporulation protein YunB
VKHRRPKGRGHPILASGVFGVLLAACLIGWFNWKISPLLRAYAAAELETQVTQLVNQLIAQDIEEGTVDYSSILIFEKNEAGEITALRSDLGEANRLRSRVISQLAAGLTQEDHSFGIPVGNLTGISLFSGRGFCVPVKVISVSTVNAAFRSDLTPAAVNQTHYKLELDISVQMSLLIPGGVYSIPVETTVTVGEAVLLGQVPESYTVFDNYASVEDAAEDYYNYG